MKTNKTLSRLYKNRPSNSIAVIVIITVAAILTNINNHLYLKKEGVITEDVKSYYSYLPAAFIYKDLSFEFIEKDPNFFKDWVYIYHTPTGGSYQKMTMGLSMLYSPFFFLGHFSARIIGAPMTGYSPPYQFWLQFGTLAYLILGLMIIRSIMRNFFSDALVAFILLTIVAGTNLFYYSTLEATISHAYNFFLFCLFIWLTRRWYEQPLWFNSIFIGLSLGLISLIRPSNSLIILFFVFFNIKSAREIKVRLRFFLETLPQLILIAFMAFMIIFPQLLYWKTYTGQWIYYTYDDEGFFFQNPQIIRGLFSYRKGWLVYTPVMIFGLTGIGFLRKKIPAFFMPILVFTVVNIYVIFSWWDFSYGGSFSSRPMIDSYGMMALSMATFTDWVHKKGKPIRWLFNGLIILLILLNIFQTLQYKYNIIHYWNMSKAAYWYNFGRLTKTPEYFNKLEPLDYDQLIQGNYATLPQEYNMILHPLVMDFEQTTKDRRLFTSADGHYKFNNAQTQSSLMPRSGNFSALLDATNSYVGTTDFYGKALQKYQITAWRKPAQSRTAIVMADIEKELFYQQSEAIDSIDKTGWGRLQLEVTLPDTSYVKYRIYLWNKSTDTVFVDDVRIELLP
ncbi:MAG: hypothetical protein M0Q41_06810 [Bacteroidales bacterium]|nr:hypothetical protein [Bacteroidales bacterium]